MPTARCNLNFPDMAGVGWCFMWIVLCHLQRDHHFLLHTVLLVPQASSHADLSLLEAVGVQIDLISDAAVEVMRVKAPARVRSALFHGI